MPHSQRVNMMASTPARTGKNSLTFESVVCTQLELQRRAASFSHRRSTMCQRPSQYRISSSSNHLSASSNRIMLLTPASSFSTSIPSDFACQFPKIRNGSKRSRSSTNSTLMSRMSTAPDRQSFISMMYWDPATRSVTSKKV
jgi:hypothetical protein